MTARDLVSGALRLIGALAAGETASADELQDGLNALSGMLGSWSTQNLIIHTKVREEITLIADQAAYTMGASVSASLNTSRPVHVDRATIEVQGSSPTIEYPLEIINFDQYVEIPAKDLGTTIPQKVYVSGTNPLETLTLWPVPTEANHLVVYSWKQFLTVTNGSTAIDLPPGYDRALRYNLAIELAPEYGKAVPAEVLAVAVEAKGLIQKANAKPVLLKCDSGIAGKRNFNINTGVW